MIGKTDEIKSYFYILDENNILRLNVIYNTSEFLLWKKGLQFELQHLYDETKEKFIYNILVNLKQSFNGWKDGRSFNELSGGLLAIQKNIDKYYPSEGESAEIIQEVNAMKQKKPKIFISHSGEDRNYVTCLVHFLENIGLGNNQLFCSSVPGYNIPLGEDIYDYLKQ